MSARSTACTCLTIMNDGARHFKECPERQEPIPDPFDVYMVHVGPSGAVFVKALDFFRSQGGFRQGWGSTWVPIVASTIEHAREFGCRLPGARLYSEQAKG